jgi:HSP20 family molecular chaperone IbpA
LSNAETADALQTQEEERASVRYPSSTTPLDERQLHLRQEQKAKGFLPSSSSSSLFLFPTTHNITTLSDYDHSLPSFTKQQQRFHNPSFQYEQHSYKQPLNIEDKNNQLLLFNKFEQPRQSSIHNQNFDLSDVPEESNSFSSTYSLSDTTLEHNDNNNQSHLLTSTPILPSPSSSYQTTNKNLSASLSTNKNNSNKPLPLTLDTTDDQSSTISTAGLITDLQRKADVYQLNNMSSSSSSSLRYSSNLGPGTITTHPYDQRISDQSNKYIIQLKTDEYQENEFIITPRYSLNQLIIDAKHREEDNIGGYIHRELHKIFNIPKHIDLNRYKYSYNKHTQELIIEMPYLQTSIITNENQNNQSFISSTHNTTEPLIYSSRTSNQNSLPTTSNRTDYYNESNNTSGIGTTANDSTLMRSSNTAVAPTYESSFGKTKPFDFDLFHRSAFRPQIVRGTSNNNEKKLLMSLDLSDYQAEDIKVSIKDRELIVKAERKIETDTRKSRTSFFQSTSLPPQTDIEHLQSNYIDGKLVIEAPYLEHNNSDRKIKTKW